MLHVRDVAHPDSAAQRRDVEVVLRDLGLEGWSITAASSKSEQVDLLSAEARDNLRSRAERKPRLAVSTITEGLRGTAGRDRSPARRHPADRRSAAAP